MLSAVVVVVAVLSITHAQEPTNYLDLYEGHTPGQRVVPVEPTGIKFYDDFLLKLSPRTHLSANDILARPFIALLAQDGQTSEYYADNGLTSVWRNPTLRPIYDYLLSSGGKAAFLFRPTTFRQDSLLKLPITKTVENKGSQIKDFFKILIGVRQLPFLLISDKDFLDGLKLDPIQHIAQIGVSPNHLPTLVKS